MTPGKLREALRIYRTCFASRGIVKKDHSLARVTDKPLGRNEILGHCFWMLEEIDKLMIAGRVEKAHRWLGFVQGCLWSLGIFDIEALRSHNRS